MFHLLKNNKIVSSCSSVFTWDWEVIEKTFSDEENEKIRKWYDFINWEFVESEESKNFIKNEKIQIFKQIKKEAVSARSEYLTAELLPDWVFKTMSLAKLEEDRINIEAKYNECMTSLVFDYGETILSELL